MSCQIVYSRQYTLLILIIRIIKIKNLLLNFPNLEHTLISTSKTGISLDYTSVRLIKFFFFFLFSYINHFITEASLEKLISYKRSRYLCTKKFNNTLGAHCSHEYTNSYYSRAGNSFFGVPMHIHDPN